MLLKNATIVDGTGNPKYVSDIRIEDNIIIEIGRNLTGDRQIDCTGKVITPGFFDIHTHYDAELLGDADLTPSTKAGVSHIIIGNCGVGVYPIGESNVEIMRDLLEGVEDIPKNLTNRCIPNLLIDFKSYLNYINSKTTVEVDSFLPYSCVRSYVLGSNSQRENYSPNSAELKQIENLIIDALENNALGISISQSIHHKSKNGTVSPSYYSTETELDLIFNLVGRYSKVIQLVNDLKYGSEDLDVITARAARYKARVLLSLQMNNQTSLQDSLFVTWQNEYKHLIDAQIHVRANAIILGEKLPRTLHNFERINYKTLFHYDKDFDYCPDYHKSIEYLSKGNYDEYIKEHGSGLFYSPNLNYINYTLEGPKLMISEPDTLIGLSDAGAHQAKMLDSAALLWALQYWQKDFSLEYLVHKITNKNSNYFRLKNNHLIIPGANSDINIIDFNQLKIGLPYIIETPYIKFVQDIKGLVRFDNLII